MYAKNKLMLSLAAAVVFIHATAAAAAQPAQPVVVSAQPPGSVVAVVDPVKPASAIAAAGESNLRKPSIPPTIATLSQLQRAEIEAEVKKRMDKLNPPPPPPPAAVAKPADIEALVAKRVQAMKPVEPDTTKTVLAIYGRQGQEQVEILMPDNSIVKTSVTAPRGASIPGFRVTRIVNGAVTVEVPVKQVAAKSSVTKKGRAPRKSQDKKAGKPVPTSEAPVMQLLTVPVGGKFN